MTRPLVIRDLGLVAYDLAYEQQKQLVEAKRADGNLADYLLLLEHPEVYTYGRKSKAEEIPQDGIEIERGGQVTFHNPGQLVGYPILRLEPGRRDLHRYLRWLEDRLIVTLARFGIVAGRRDGATGVWVNDGQQKIASIGVAVSGWVTYHGFALNVCNELKGFAKIHPCGFDSRVMTSMLELLGAADCPSMESVKAEILREFAAHSWMGGQPFLEEAAESEKIFGKTAYV
ncbi:MAG: lipoyl(octanoyl) transferase LipB [Bdellovibrionaceae bacterium]|nr:lipoyl(octanoyl) transferase LipB [Bdellovibrionales bacterium]MCB9253408.1 lipoyl(octanoyl) transferase LipB [Pseudobdellovibrionaceae bacterium]